MRTLYEIINDAKDGIRPSADECYYALLAYESMMTMDHGKLRNILSSEKPLPKFIAELELNNSHNMYRNALNKSPQDWLGWNYDPANPAYQEFRRVGGKILDKVIKKMEHKEAAN